MLRSLRPALTLVLVVALVVTTTACHDSTSLTITAPQMPAPGADRIVGVTTTDGIVVTFDDPATLVDPRTNEKPTPEALSDPESGVLVVGKVKDRKTAVKLSAVQRFHVVQLKGNTWKTVGLVVGIAAAGTLAGVAIAGTSHSSTQTTTTSSGKMGCCPFFYSWDGNRWIFDAEPYSGAITRGLERSGDVVLDRLREGDGVYRVLMTNERAEIDFTNHVSLRVVDHAPGVRVVPGDDGTLYPVNDSGSVPPTSARTSDGRDLGLWLSATDARVYEPEPPARGETAFRDEIVLTFPKPPDAQSAKLVVSVGASAWGSVMLTRFVEIRGRELPAWYAALDGSPAAVAATYEWNLRAELWGLRLDVELPTGWQTRGALLGAGPLVVKDRVVPLDLRGTTGDVLRLRVRPPRGYWALNSFAVDYSKDEPMTVTELPLLSASDAAGTDRRPALLAADDAYDVMPPGDGPVTLTFRAPEARPGLARTVVLHARGYYRYDLPPGGEPDRAAIRGFETEPDFGVRHLRDLLATPGSLHRGELD